MNSSSIVALAGDSTGSSCGYCHSKQDTSFSSGGLWAYHLHPATYQTLIDCGWRRAGKYLYKPNIAKTCCPAYTIRLDSTAFVLSASNKKAAKKVKKLLSQTQTASTESTDVDSEWIDEGEEVRDAGLAGLEENMRPNLPATKSESLMSVDIAPEASHNIPKIDEKPEPSQKEKPKTEKVAWVKQPKKAKNIPKDDVLALITEIEGVQTINGNKWEVKLVPASFEEDTFELYTKYQINVHKDPPTKIKKAGFTGFLVDSPLTFIPATDIIPKSKIVEKKLESFPGYGSFHQKYYLNGKLIAVSVLDILPACVSAVYFMYDPTSAVVRSLSIGVYSALRECALAKEFSHILPNLKYYYMGFYIHSCSKMRYKAQFKPSDLVCPKTREWVPVELCTKLLDVHKVARLSAALNLKDGHVPESTDQSVFGPSAIAHEFPIDIKDIGNIMIYQEGGVVLLKMMPPNRKVLSDIGQFIQLVGNDVAKKLIFVV